MIHVHGPYLGAWASAHRPLPIRYAPAARYTRAREIPVYIDRRPGEPRFIVDTIRRDPDVPAIIEANGGTCRSGIRPHRRIRPRSCRSTSARTGRSTGTARQ
ncbi:hypothetical protein [Burkholderia sp. SIMBA_062]|uniref:hypothetical protein n=1 Tax=Burkholderia sp. SIMBA_062 TaxID=3085803 RepID=UPI00397BC731